MAKNERIRVSVGEPEYKHVCAYGPGACLYSLNGDCHLRIWIKIPVEIKGQKDRLKHVSFKVGKEQIFALKAQVDLVVEMLHADHIRNFGGRLNG